jgi:hypothetical protein
MEKIEINVDVITGKTSQTSRPFTAEEINATQAIEAQEAQTKQAAKDTKASALAKLAALGLTQDEVKALIG